ncbi:sensor histidine kinase [Actinomycetospora sp. NBC_00405]|uniref:sensor histidine kinase n=1 Tax=Actinomycetospora sp. NBC_00405 TaxID=2975952 RepID=UPI002E1D212C
MQVLTTVRAAMPRPWWWDGGIAVLYAVVAVLGVLVWPLFVLPPGLPVPPVLRLAVPLVLAALTVLRTRRPVPALLAAVPLVVLDAALGLSLAAALVLADLLYCVALHGSTAASERVRTASFTAFGGLVVLVLLVTGDARTTATTALSASAVLLLPVAWAREVRRPTEEAAATRREAAQAARIAELDRRGAVADERARVARDLHDSVAGHLSAIALQSQAALGADATTPGGSALRDRVLTSVRENSVRALDEMRALIDVLRRDEEGDGTDEARRVPARLADLPELVESARVGGLVVDADLAALDDEAVPAPVGLTVYRIAQEALTNVGRHAPGATVTLALARDDADLVLDVSNTVPAPTVPRPGSGTGVEGMRVRAEAVGGSASAGPDGDRWRVCARLPLGASS